MRKPKLHTFHKKAESVKPSAANSSPYTFLEIQKVCGLKD